MLSSSWPQARAATRGVCLQRPLVFLITFARRLLNTWGKSVAVTEAPEEETHGYKTQKHSRIIFLHVEKKRSLARPQLQDNVGGDAVKTFFLVSEVRSEGEEHTPSRLATMVTNPVPAPSSSTSFPCMSTLSLLLSRKEDRANACGTSRGTVSPCVCVHLRQQVSKGNSLRATSPLRSDRWTRG